MAFPTDVRSQRFTAPAPRRLAVGDILPPVRLPDIDGKSVALNSDQIAGNFLVLVFCDPRSDAGAAILAQCADKSAELSAQGARLFAIVGGDPGQPAGRLPFPMLCDAEGRAFSLFGIGDPAAGPAVVLVRPNGHVMVAVDQPAKDGLAAVAGAIAAEAENRQGRLTARHPPILIVPDVLSRQDCRHLITVYALQGNVWVEPGHGAQNMVGDYKMRIPDYGRRDRIDHWVINAETTRFIAERLSARLFPEIEKAYQYRITRFERFRIGCYEGERGGEAHGHRDNTAPMVAHRRFACSINLNTEEFEGGELRFPEFGGHLYRPETGAAITFSSSVLHEPLHVTAGRRYVLLAFLFGES